MDSDPSKDTNLYDYVLVFPTLSTEGFDDDASKDYRLRYSEALGMIQMCVGGDEAREESARKEFESAWVSKFRSVRPIASDTLPFTSFIQLMREVVLRRLENIDGLYVQSVTHHNTKVYCILRASLTLLTQEADDASLNLPIWSEVDLESSYWKNDANLKTESFIWASRELAEKELYRLFLAGQIKASEATIHPEETPGMWSRRIHVLKRRILHHNFANMTPYYFPYKASAHLQYLYSHINYDYRNVQTSVTSPFRRIDKIRLLKRLLDREFDLEKLVDYNVLTAHYCPHYYGNNTNNHNDDDTCLDSLKSQWGNFGAPVSIYNKTSKVSLTFQPLSSIRNYFGEEIALYFAYLSFYADSTKILALFSVVSLLLEGFSETAVLRLYKPCIAIVFCIFSAVFIARWENQEQALAITWGVHSSDLMKTTLLPGYKGQSQQCPITNRPIIVARRSTQLVKTIVVLLASVLVVLLSVSASATFIYLQQQSYISENLAHILMAMFVPVSCSVCHSIAIRLNKFQNHRTQEQYDTSLTLKYTVFQTFNYYTCLTYVVFIKPLGSNSRSSSLEEGRVLLRLTIAVLLVVNFCQVLLPRVVFHFRKKQEKKDSCRNNVPLLLGSNKSTGTDDEIQELQQYDGVLSDYAQIVMLFGFITCFGVLDPVSAVLAYVFAIFQVRSDANSLVYYNQRPFPTTGVSNIGRPWKTYLRFLSIASVFTNSAALVTFYQDEKFSYYDKIFDYTMLVVCLGLLWTVASFTTSAYCRQKSEHRMSVQKRNEVLVNKYLHHGAEGVLKGTIAVAGSVKCNGVFCHVINGSTQLEDAVDEAHDRLLNLQLLQDTMQLNVNKLRKSTGPSVGTLTIYVGSINVLPVMDRLSGSMDPFLKFKLCDKSKTKASTTIKTSVIKKTLHPDWKEEVVEFDGITSLLDSVVKIKVMDWDMMGKNDKVGSTEVRVTSEVWNTEACYTLPIEMKSKKLLLSMGNNVKKFGKPVLKLKMKLTLTRHGVAATELQRLKDQIAECQSEIEGYCKWQEAAVAE